MLIVDQLKELIFAGELNIGEKLPPERILAQQFGVARPTVREALSALEVLGIIDVQVGSGAYVLQVPQEDSPHTLQQVDEESSPLELYDIRNTVEGLAAAKAAQHASKEEIAAIRAIVSSMEQDLDQNIFSLEKDRAFHLSLAQATGNIYLIEIMNYLLGVMQKRLWQTYIMKNIEIEGHKAKYVHNHRKILEAIATHDPEQAQRLMTEHLQGVIDLDDWDEPRSSS
jgi:GntR family transcriptional repressor for pyruvate dehydrogenase complex